MTTEELLARADARMNDADQWRDWHDDPDYALVRDLAAALSAETSRADRAVEAFDHMNARADGAEAALEEARSVDWWARCMEAEAALETAKQLRDMAIREGDDLSATLDEARDQYRGLNDFWGQAMTNQAEYLVEARASLAVARRFLRKHFLYLDTTPGPEELHMVNTSPVLTDEDKQELLALLAGQEKP